VNANGDTRAFLGVGWSFPVDLKASSISTAAYEQDIKQAIRIILGTNPGERVMRPDFGAGLNRFVFEPINTATMEGLKRRVRGALIDWEPRIDVTKVHVRAATREQGKLLIEIDYMVRSTNTEDNLVYPFYLQEGSAS
jgi:phage baseplate assembly protein W